MCGTCRAHVEHAPRIEVAAWRLRFSKDGCPHQGKPRLPLCTIGKALSLSPSTIGRYCSSRNIRGQIQKSKVPGSRTKLTMQHKDFLCLQSNLQEWAGKTLAERAVIFHRAYPELHVSPSTIQKLYKYRRIKRKTIEHQKLWPASRIDHYNGLFQIMPLELTAADAKDKLIIFVDEAIFSTQTMPTLAFSSVGENVHVDSSQISIQALAVVAGVSRENGLEHWRSQPRSINSEAFIAFVQDLVERHPGRPIVLFVDNCRVHHSKAVKRYLASAGVDIIFNVPYSPQYNPIERVWSMVKQHYRRSKLAALVEGRKLVHAALLRASMNSGRPESIKHICNKVLSDLMGWV